MRDAQPRHAYDALVPRLAMWYCIGTAAMEQPVQGTKQMSKRSKQAHAIVELEPPVVVELETPTFADMPEAVEIDDEVAEDNAKPASVVRPGYKAKYAQRAAEAGLGKKAQRSCWDWLAQTLAGECLDDAAKISIERFLSILEANGVDHSRWTNRNKGWEGRLRMTGRLALQKIVAANGHLKTADGEELVAPAEWVAKFTN